MPFQDKFSENLDVTIHGVRLPEIQIDNKFKEELGLPTTITNIEFLRELCLKGFKELKLEKNSPKYKQYADRVKTELDIITELGFTDYILMVWDVINYCNEKDIPLGRGRGSGAGSLVLYLTKITKVDPIEHNLYFERFISKTRAKKQIIDGITYLDGSLMLDIDNDICYYRREEVLDYVSQKYPDKVSKILTYTTLGGKILIKECGKIVSGQDDSEMTKVSSNIQSIFGKLEDIDKAYETSEDFKKWCDSNKKAYKIALNLRDLIKNKSVHASGMMISYYPLSDSCPIELSSDGRLVSSYDMSQVTLFNVKLDLLGVRSVSVVADACKTIGITEEKINVHDLEIYRFLYDLKYPHGLFQIESDASFHTTQKVKPRNFEQLMAILAIARPSSMKFTDEYASFTNNGILSELDLDSPKLKEILAETSNIILFQETLMKIANQVFELSLEDAELIRRACGKKSKKDMEKYQDIIFKQGEKLKIPKSAKFYWDILIASADYGFNKCLHPQTIVSTPSGYIEAGNIRIGEKIYCYSDGKKKETEVLSIFKKGKTKFVEYTFSDGRQIICSEEHKFMTEDGKMVKISDIFAQNLSIVIDESIEFFKDIPGYEGIYKISNKGNIINVNPDNQKRESSRYHFLKGEVDKDGYKKNLLGGKKNKRKFFTHRLVAMAFINNPQKLPCINHKNGIKLDNSVENLEWTSIADNNRHAYKTGLNKHHPEHFPHEKGEKSPVSKLKNEQVLEIRRMRSEGISSTKIAKIFGISYYTVHRIVNRKGWTHI